VVGLNFLDITFYASLLIFPFKTAFANFSAPSDPSCFTVSLAAAFVAFRVPPLTPGTNKPTVDNAAFVKLPVANPVIIPVASIISLTPGINPPTTSAVVAIAAPAEYL
jgi:hypothetical protein